MTNDQIYLIQTSFVKILSEATAFSNNFYSRLFELAPQVRPLFKNDMEEQGDKLIKMLAMIVNNLYDLEDIERQAAELGHRHFSYGVKNEHYNYAKRALMEAIEEQLGDEFAPEIAIAWQQVFDNLSQYMMNAKYQPETNLWQKL